MIEHCSKCLKACEMSYANSRCSNCKCELRDGWMVVAPYTEIIPGRHVDRKKIYANICKECAPSARCAIDLTLTLLMRNELTKD